MPHTVLGTERQTVKVGGQNALAVGASWATTKERSRVLDQWHDVVGMEFRPWVTSGESRQWIKKGRQEAHHRHHLLTWPWGGSIVTWLAFWKGSFGCSGKVFCYNLPVTRSKISSCEEVWAGEHRALGSRKPRLPILPICPHKQVPVRGALTTLLSHERARLGIRKSRFKFCHCHVQVMGPVEIANPVSVSVSSLTVRWPHRAVAEWNEAYVLWEGM